MCLEGTTQVVCQVTVVSWFSAVDRTVRLRNVSEKGFENLKKKEGKKALSNKVGTHTGTSALSCKDEPWQRSLYTN